MVPDDGGSTVGRTVRATFSAIRTNSPITAKVGSVVRTGDGCRKVEIRFFRQGSTNAVGSVFYTHIIPSSDVNYDDTVSLSSGKDVGKVALGSQIPIRDDVGGTKIKEEIDRRVQAGTLIEVASNTYGGKESVWVDGKEYFVRHMFGTWHEPRWRSSDGEPEPTNADGEHIADGERCPTTAAHLHQQADVGAGTILWRNTDRTDRLDDDGMGIENASIVDGKYTFCSDSWLFKVYPATPAGEDEEDWAPLAAPAEPCGAPDAAPANLTATRGSGEITLTWTNPGDASISEYQVRRRLSSATTADASPWGTGWTTITGSSAMTTEHIVSGLTNGTAYTIQVRARNAHGVGPPATIRATPGEQSTPTPTPVPPTPTPQPTDATLTISVSPAHCGSVSWQSIDALPSISSGTTTSPWTIPRHRDIRITGPADSGSCQFSRWDGDCSRKVRQTCDLRMSRDMTATAHYLDPGFSEHHHPQSEHRPLDLRPHRRPPPGLRGGGCCTLRRGRERDPSCEQDPHYLPRRQTAHRSQGRNNDLPVL